MRLDTSITPTATTDAQNCQRLYAWLRWLKWFPPGEVRVRSESAEKGEIFHGYAEDWVARGQLPSANAPHQELFQAVLPWSPRVLRGETETWLNVKAGPEQGGQTYGAKADWFGKLVDLPRFPAASVYDLPAALDYKSSSSPEYYGLMHRDALLADHQAIIVGTGVARKFNAPAVALRWLYTKTKGQPKGVPTDAVVSRGELEFAFQSKVIPAGDRVIQIRRKVRAPSDVLSLDLPSLHGEVANSVCFNYHRQCSYYSVCFPQESVMSLPNQAPFPLQGAPANGVAPAQQQYQQPPQQQQIPSLGQPQQGTMQQAPQQYQQPPQQQWQQPPQQQQQAYQPQQTPVQYQVAGAPLAAPQVVQGPPPGALFAQLEQTQGAVPPAAVNTGVNPPEVQAVSEPEFVRALAIVLRYLRQ